MRGVCSAKGGPDFSVGGVPVWCNCLDVDHMKEEVLVSVQVELKEKSKEQSEEQREQTLKQPHT